MVKLKHYSIPKVIDSHAQIAYALHMKARLTPDLEAKLNQFSATGRAKEELLQDAIIGYLTELLQVGSKLDGRYDDIKSSRVKAIDGEDVFIRLRQKKTDHRHR